MHKAQQAAREHSISTAQDNPKPNGVRSTPEGFGDVNETGAGTGDANAETDSSVSK